MMKLATFWLMLIVVVTRDEKEGAVETTELQVSGVSFSNHSLNATLPTATTTVQQILKVGDSSSRSEVYKMHANGLMLLHAQRTRSGVGAKKSQLNNKSTNSGINYHVRKKTNETVTAVEAAENERHLEAKLGDLPQVRQKRSRDLPQVQKKSVVVYSNSKENIFQVDIKKRDTSSTTSRPCSNTGLNVTSSIACHHRSHHHGHHHHHRRHKHQWRSIVQGEDIYGEEVKKTKVYPEKLTDKRKPKTKHVVHKKHRVVKKAPLLTPGEVSKHSRLRRALTLMMGDMFDDNPLYDSQQPGVMRVNDNPQRDIQDIEELGDLHDREMAEPMSMIPPISPIRKSMQEFHHRSSINEEPNYLAFHQQQSNIFDDGQKSDDFKYIPGIPRITPLRIEDELLTGRHLSDINRIKPLRVDEEEEDSVEEEAEKREHLFKNEFDDEELEKVSTIKELTPPTAIPFLSTVSSIPMISDIPTLKDIPPPTKHPGTVGGKGTWNGKMPLIHTVDTKEGKETHISV